MERVNTMANPTSEVTADIVGLGNSVEPAHIGCDLKRCRQVASEKVHLMREKAKPSVAITYKGMYSMDEGHPERAAGTPRWTFTSRWVITTPTKPFF